MQTLAQRLREEGAKAERQKFEAEKKKAEEEKLKYHFPITPIFQTHYHIFPSFQTSVSKANKIQNLS